MKDILEEGLADRRTCYQKVLFPAGPSGRRIYGYQKDRLTKGYADRRKCRRTDKQIDGFTVDRLTVGETGRRSG